MKRFVLIALLSCLPLFAQAQWFQVQSYHNVNPLQVTATVYNHWGAPIYCQGRVDGQTHFGSVYYGYMNTWIYPGTYGFIYTYTNASNPFVSGWSQVWCRY